MINGMINVYKEKGYTSHDVVAKLRGILGQKKIGHTGTLDPEAEGVLPICLGKGTKLCDMLTDKDKTYQTVLLLGKTTDTQDITGKVLSQGDTTIFTEEEISQCIGAYIGEYEQLPPMYSALKVKGKKLYELARQGIEVERTKRTVRILDIHIQDIEFPRVYMQVTCSKGTYIRTLCHDIGVDLGCGGCMESLIRTRVSFFELADSLKLADISQYKEQGQLLRVIMPVDAMFKNLSKMIVAEEYASLAYNGNPLLGEYLQNWGYKVKSSMAYRIRVYDEKCRFIGIYQYAAEKQHYSLEKMFFDFCGEPAGMYKE